MGLADGRVPGEATALLVDGELGRGTVRLVDDDDSAPLGEASTSLVCIGAALSESIEAIGGGLLRSSTSDGLLALVQLDSDVDSLLLEQVHQRRAISSLLEESLLEDNAPRNVLA